MSHGGIDFRPWRKSIPYWPGSVSSLVMIEISLKWRLISAETYIKLREVLVVAVYGLKPLQFQGFCDTILILRKRGAPNNRWNINIFAKVFSAKSPQIHPTISEFAEWE